MYRILFKKKAEKELKQLPKTILLKTIVVIDGLSENPKPTGCKKLKGSSENLWRVRVGTYRIIYVIEVVIKVIDIRKIAHRKDVYNF